MQPVLSIGLPVLNGERFIAEALDSLLEQEFTDFELIVSDNASTDRTNAIVEGYASGDARIRHVRLERRHGAAYNFNLVARLGRGRYFKWAAHDDVCGPRFLGSCVAALDRDPTAVLSYPRAVQIDADGDVTKQFPAYDYAFEDRPSARVHSFLTQRPACLEAYGVMRRDTLLDTRLIGPFSTADGVFLLEMMLRGRFVRVDSVEFLCRTHAERSLAKYQQSRRHWFDDSPPKGRGFPEWRLTGELVKAVLRAPIQPGEQGRALWHLSTWASRNSTVLARDVVATAKATARRATSTARELQGLEAPARRKIDAQG